MSPGRARGMVVRVSGHGLHVPCPRASQSHSLGWGQLPGVTEPLCHMQTPPFPGQVTSEHVMPQSCWTRPLPAPPACCPVCSAGPLPWLKWMGQSPLFLSGQLPGRLLRASHCVQGLSKEDPQWPWVLAESRAEEPSPSPPGHPFLEQVSRPPRSLEPEAAALSQPWRMTVPRLPGVACS